VFKSIADACGLTTIRIEGEVRTVIPHTDPLTRKRQRQTPFGTFYNDHGWNAVKIEGSWYLHDPSGHVTTARVKRNNRVEEKGEPDWSHFLVPPEQAIRVMLPRNKAQQFLKTPLERKEQESLPVLYPAAFEHGIKPISHPGPFVTAGGEAILTLEVPKGVWVRPHVLDDKGEPAKYASASARRDGTTVQVRLHLAEAGTYVLHVMVKKRDEQSQLGSSAICYQIQATAGKDGPPPPEIQLHGQGREAVPILPRTRTLKVGEKVQFLAYLPKATEAHVFCQKTKEQIELKGKDGYFAGEVKVESGDVCVFARYADDDKQYLGVIGYKGE
jgi:hypothetical protein